jgi:hypothetical protein
MHKIYLKRSHLFEISKTFLKKRLNWSVWSYTPRFHEIPVNLTKLVGEKTLDWHAENLPR